jgi:hypothetical protein
MKNDREFIAMRGIKRHLDALSDDPRAVNRVMSWVVDKVNVPNKSLSGSQISQIQDESRTSLGSASLVGNTSTLMENVAHKHSELSSYDR